jgi:DNA modification methylase
MKGCGGKIAGLPCCTVIHGDCEKYLGRFAPGCVDLVLTDPPFGMNLKMRQKENRPIHGDHRFPVETIKRLIKLPRLASYFFCRWDNLWNHGDLPKPKSVVVWAKECGGGSGDTAHEHSRAYEMAMFFPNLSNHKFSSRPDDVVTVQRAGNYLHTTQKPVELMQQMLEWYEFTTVLDPYAGCGSTLRAARLLKKHFLGFEIDKVNHAEAVHLIERPVPEARTTPTADAQPRLFLDRV